MLVDHDPQGGPHFVKVGRSVRYRITDALAFEDDALEGGLGTNPATAAAPILSSPAPKPTVAQAATLARVRKFLATAGHSR